MLIYLSGCVASIFLFKDIFAQPRLKNFSRLALCLGCFFFSWIGYFAYNLAIKIYLNTPRES